MTLPAVARGGALRLLQVKATVAELRGRLKDGSQVSAIARVMVFRSLALLVNLCTGIVVAASLGPQGRGELAALLLAPQFVGAIAMLGLPMAYIYHSKADPALAREYFGGALLLSVPISCVALAITWAIIPDWLGSHDASTIELARILLLILPFSVLIPLLTGVLDADGRFGLSSGIQYLQPLGCAVLLVLFIGFGALTPSLAALAYTLPVLLTCAVAAWQAGRVLRPSLTLAAPVRRRLLHYGLRRYGFEAIGSMSTYMDQILVVHFLPAASAGVYAAALSLSRALGVMQDAVASVLFPGLAGRSIAEVVEIVGLATRVSTALAAAAGLALGLLGPHVIALLYGSAFASAVAPFRLLMAAIVTLGATRILGHAFTATGRPGAVTVVEAVGVAATLLAMWILMPLFGVDGAAGAVLIGAVVRLACTMVFLKLVLRVSIPRLVIGRADLHWLVKQ